MSGVVGAAEKTDLQRTSVITFFIGNHLPLKGKPARKGPSTSINSSLSPTSCLDPEAADWPHPYLSDGNGQIVKKLISTCPSLTSPFNHGSNDSAKPSGACQALAKWTVQAPGSGEEGGFKVRKISLFPLFGAAQVGNPPGTHWVLWGQRFHTQEGCQSSPLPVSCGASHLLLP